MGGGGTEGNRDRRGDWGAKERWQNLRHKGRRKRQIERRKGACVRACVHVCVGEAECEGRSGGLSYWAV